MRRTRTVCAQPCIVDVASHAERCSAFRKDGLKLNRRLVIKFFHDRQLHQPPVCEQKRLKQQRATVAKANGNDGNCRSEWHGKQCCAKVTMAKTREELLLRRRREQELAAEARLDSKKGAVWSSLWNCLGMHLEIANIFMTVAIQSYSFCKL